MGFHDIDCWMLLTASKIYLYVLTANSNLWSLLFPFSFHKPNPVAGFRHLNFCYHWVASAVGTTCKRTKQREWGSSSCCHKCSQDWLLSLPFYFKISWHEKSQWLSSPTLFWLPVSMTLTACFGNANCPLKLRKGYKTVTQLEGNSDTLLPA